MNIDGLELELISEASLRYTVDKKTFLPIDSDIIIKFDLNHGSKEGIAINVKYSNINNVKEIIIPKEALEAKEEKSIEEQLQETNKIENTEKDDKVDKKF